MRADPLAGPAPHRCHTCPHACIPRKDAHIDKYKPLGTIPNMYRPIAVSRFKSTNKCFTKKFDSESLQSSLSSKDAKVTGHLGGHYTYFVAFSVRQTKDRCLLFQGPYQKTTTPLTRTQGNGAVTAARATPAGGGLISPQFPRFDSLCKLCAYPIGARVFPHDLSPVVSFRQLGPSRPSLGSRRSDRVEDKLELVHLVLPRKDS